ncbi:hypothetical protein SEA_PAULODIABOLI_287 [Microbacterium phage PauloDiaboli]|nr:hypothetical protein SEA_PAULODIABOLI_287 [Microbacterium phage PauloDiaboli]
MSRNDGRPRSAVSLSRDPLPIRHNSGEYRFPDRDTAATATGEPEPGGAWDFKPRPGFIQDEEAYE